MYNYSDITWHRNELDEKSSDVMLHVYYELEHGSVIHPSNNETSFWTIFTLTCSSVGIALSAAALALLILTAFLFAEWRQSYKNQLLIQFMLARLFYTSVRFFSDIQHVFKMCSTSDSLIFLDILTMIYTEMVLIAWMFVFSRQMYISLVKVFVTESNIWKVSVCAWLVPAMISLLLHTILYFSRDTYTTFFILYVVLIKWPVLIANAVLLILVLRSVLINNRNTEKNIRIVVVMIVLIFVFCFQQMLIDITKIVFIKFVERNCIMSTSLLISNILSMYHCAFSIVFWVLGNANTRKLWKFQGRDLRGKIRLSVKFNS